MASKNPSINLSVRDHQVLTALIRTPLDAKQLLSLSQTFDRPFTHDRLVRRRLSELAAADLVKSFKYSTIGAGSLNYYKLTPTGYRMIQGPTASLPPRSYFRAVSMSLQEHTRALADFVVKTQLNAKASGAELGGFYRENQLRLTLGDKRMQPDCAFQLQLPDGKNFNYLIEIDCGTEPIRSTKQRESLEQKIRFYDDYQDSIDARFRVLVIFTKPSARMRHFVQIAGEVIKDPQRTLCCAAQLSDYLKPQETFSVPLFLDRYQQPVALIPTASGRQEVLQTPQKETVFLAA